jgi:hypothetical protein
MCEYQECFQFNTPCDMNKTSNTESEARVWFRLHSKKCIKCKGAKFIVTADETVIYNMRRPHSHRTAEAERIYNDTQRSPNQFLEALLFS